MSKAQTDPEIEKKLTFAMEILEPLFGANPVAIMVYAPLYGVEVKEGEPVKAQTYFMTNGELDKMCRVVKEYVTKFEAGEVVDPRIGREDDEGSA